MLNIVHKKRKKSNSLQTEGVCTVRFRRGSINGFKELGKGGEREKL